MGEIIGGIIVIALVIIACAIIICLSLGFCGVALAVGAVGGLLIAVIKGIVNYFKSLKKSLKFKQY